MKQNIFALAAMLALLLIIGTVGGVEAGHMSFDNGLARIAGLTLAGIARAYKARLFCWQKGW